MTTAAGIRWQRKADEEWAAAFEFHLVMRHLPPREVTERALAEVHEAVTAAGGSARDLFGDPAAYADAVAAEATDEKHAAKAGVDGVTAGERFAHTLLVAALIGGGLAALHWFQDGLWLAFSWVSLTALATVVTAVLLVCGAVALRTAGRVRAVWASLGAAAAAVAGGSFVMSVLPGQRLFALPAPLLMAACAALAAGAHRLSADTVDAWFDPPRPRNAEAWLRRLEGLLRGRHGMSRKEAYEHVAEARSHVREDPQALVDFGDVETYAAGLAAGPRRTRRAERRKALGAAGFALAVGVAGFDRLRAADLTSFWFWLTAAALGFAVVEVVRPLRGAVRS
ncbi:hypothetical protein [Streptomyces huiliensis]|uniref:hypothetical protein n=1 Tax=Streptomyces huiliensis TaxID=2876027 RepID=UPI001CBC3585|nr:hypothetical protein [Streptomyces huiliensis]MBZ4320103.1 hypothetical protein [Streptomyces huiliensis]